MERNRIYLIVGALVAGVFVLGFFLYQERQETTGVEISVGRGGVSIEAK